MKYASDFRAIARDALRGKWMIAVIVGLVAALLGGGGSDGPQVKLNISETGANLDFAFAGQTVYSTGGSLHSGIGAFLVGSAVYIALAAIVIAVIYFVLGSIIQVGYARFNLELVDRHDPSFDSLFAYFSYWKTTAVARLLQSLYVLLWTLLLIIPGIIAGYSYAMTEYILAEHPEFTASEAIDRSKQMMSGNRWRLFCMQFSFIGWDILSALTLGIGSLWVRPYKQAATAAFYREVSGTEQTAYARKLEEHSMFTMGDVARQSVLNDEVLYKLFGVNAELLIDHAWGWEPCTIADIKAYKPESNSIGSGQVLHCPYTAEKAKLVVREMADLLVLDLVDKGLVTDQIVLTVGYDIENLTDPKRSHSYKGAVTTDHYGRKIPKHAHGTGNLGKYTSSTREILQAVSELYDRIVDGDLLVRRLNIVANHVIDEASVPAQPEVEQLDLFTDYEARGRQQAENAAVLEREKLQQQAVLSIKKKFGKNAILKGMNLEEGATARDRNAQIGGHKA